MLKKTEIALIVTLTILVFNSLTVKAEILTFEDILSKSIQNSYGLKIADVDVNISKAGVKEAKAEYYPTLKLGYNNEYSRNLRGNQRNFSSVGSTFINPVTRFQNLISLNLNYNVFDFGARGKRKLIARKDVFQKEFEYFRALRDLKLEVLDYYSDALIAYKEIKALEMIQQLNTELFETKVRLYEAGESSKLEIMDEAVNIAGAKYRIDKTKHKLNNLLKELSYLTFEDYDPEKVTLKNFENFNNFEIYNNEVDYAPFKDLIEEKLIKIPEFKENVVLEHKIYNIEIEKKREELKLIKKERLPKVEFYTSYLFYGSDNDDPVQSVVNIRNQNVAVGVSAVMPLFDGFKNAAQQEKARLEIERLELERDQKTYEVKKKYELLKQDAESLKKDFLNNESLLREYKKQLIALERLFKNKLINKTELLKKKSELLNQISQLETDLITAHSTFKKLEFLSEGY